MKRILCCLAALALAACAHGQVVKAPGCKGERRPANIHGSVLQLSPSSAPGAPATAPAEPKPKQQSVLDPSVGLCGGRLG